MHPLDILYSATKSTVDVSGQTSFTLAWKLVIIAGPALVFTVRIFLWLVRPKPLGWTPFITGLTRSNLQVGQVIAKSWQPLLYLIILTVVFIGNVISEAYKAGIASTQPDIASLEARVKDLRTVPPPTKVQDPARLIIQRNGKGLDGSTVVLSGSLELDGLQLRNAGAMQSGAITVRVYFSRTARVIEYSWINYQSEDTGFPSAISLSVSSISPNETTALAAMDLIDASLPMTVKIKAFFGTKEPSEAVFKLQSGRP